MTTSAAPGVNPTSPPSAATLDATLQRLHVYTSETLNSMCIREGQKPFVVEGLFPVGSIGFVVGDSGLGKSPLIYQLALCVAAGIPWLGMRTAKGPVLFLDLENGWLGSQKIRDSVMRHLALTTCPAGFFCTQDIRNVRDLRAAIDATKPALVIIDTLRSYAPGAEENNTKAGQFLQEFRKICNECGASFVIVHHTKKPTESTNFHTAADLETDPVMQWLNSACGARGLINQTDVRIGVAQSTKANAALLVRGHVRISGEIGPFYLERVFDDDGQPTGYRPLAGVESLDNKSQQVAFEKLLAAFSFKEAKTIYGKQDQATLDFLRKCERAGILRKVAKGRYEKVTAAASPRNPGMGGV
jgi:hypothetical protein